MVGKMQFKSPVSEAKRIIKEYKLNSAPIDVVALCEALDIDLHYTNLGSIERAAGRPIDGLIQKRPDGLCVILVNEEAIETRSRFTIAHELGHYFLHMEAEPDGIITSFRGDRSPRETEANNFAAELLMPKDILIKEYNSLVIPVSETLARKFNVSKQAMEIRLQRLELMYV